MTIELSEYLLNKIADAVAGKIGDAVARKIGKPCDDTISRQAVLDINEHYHGQMTSHVNHEIWKEIKALPPVTPQPKMGRWISLGTKGEVDGQIVRTFTCSECGAISIFRVTSGNIVNGDLCPNCCAKMQEDKE